MVRILEEVLPKRFGGTPLDYQLLESEDGGGLTRVSLLIGPAVAGIDEKAVTDTVFAVLRDVARDSRPSVVIRGGWIERVCGRLARDDGTEHQQNSSNAQDWTASDHGTPPISIQADARPQRKGSDPVLSQDHRAQDRKRADSPS